MPAPGSSKSKSFGSLARARVLARIALEADEAQQFAGTFAHAPLLGALPRRMQ
jgi:hypothetical protein